MVCGSQFPVIAVIGAGNGGFAFAACMAKCGAEVRLCEKDPSVIDAVVQHGGIDLIGYGETCFVKLDMITNSIAKAVTGSDLVMIVTPANSHRAVAEEILPYLQKDMMIVLNPGRTGGVLEFEKILADHHVAFNVLIAEAQTLLFACRKTDNKKITIKGIKNKVPIASTSLGNAIKIASVLNRFFPQFVPEKNILVTSLTNIGAIFHPVPAILNTARIETSQDSFEYYVEGISPTIAAFLEKIDAERVAVAAAYGIQVPTAFDWLKSAYNIEANSLYDALQKNPAYKGIKGPTDIHVRYITEDVPTGLVPISAFGKIAGVHTPLIDAVIQMASGLLDIPFSAIGRNASRMGIENLNREEVLARIS